MLIFKLAIMNNNNNNEPEPVVKKNKTDEEAIHSISTLPIDILEKIFLMNKPIDVRQIKEICTFNKQFKKMCDRGIIFYEIIKRKYKMNQERLKQLRQLLRNVHPIHIYVAIASFASNKNIGSYREITFHSEKGYSYVTTNDDEKIIVKLPKFSASFFLTAGNTLKELNTNIDIKRVYKVGNSVIEITKFQKNEIMMIFLIVSAYISQRGFEEQHKSKNFYLGCNVCGHPEPKHRCSACKSVLYCSEKCQIIDWNENNHNKQCF